MCAFIRFLLFPLLLFVGVSRGLWAQVEYNVRLAPTATAVQAWLERQGGAPIRAAEVPPALAARYPFLADWQQAESLLPQLRPGNPLEGVYTVALSAGPAARTLAQMQGSGLFSWVEPNKSWQVDRSLPEAPLPYRPNDDSLAAQWYLDYLRAPQAWDLTRGDATVRIGIIDTGLDYDHPEFEGQLAINAAEDLNGNGRLDPWPSSEVRAGRSGDFDGQDNDGNGYADDVIGYDFVDQPREPFGGDYLQADPDPMDDNAHGTLVAGVIGARADNRYGGTGLAPGCRLMILRAFAATGSGQDDDVARAIVYAADQGVEVLNLSFGDVYTSTLMREAIRYAYQKGVVMVGSAGNGTGDNLHYPSGYNEVISVSASAVDLASGREFLWPVSSYGVTVDLCAPGANIFTTTLRDSSAEGKPFTRTQGTSFSAPMAAAAAALVMSHRGPRTPEQIRGILTTSADDLGEAGWDHFTGAGRLNLLRALRTVGASVVRIESPDTDAGSAADSVAIVGTVMDPEFVRFHLDYQAGTQDTSEWQPLLSAQRYQRYQDTLAIWDLRSLPEGDYALRLRLERSNGFTREHRIRFVRDTTPPTIDIRRAVPIWDNDRRAFFLAFRTSDRGTQTLRYRRQGSLAWQEARLGRIVRNGALLLGRSELSPGPYEWSLHSRNEAGLSQQTPVDTFVYDGGFIPRNGWRELAYGLPLGRMLEQPYDFDQDGLLEVVMSEYSPELSLGPLKHYEFNGGFFRQVDSSTFRPVLIPRAVADTDGDQRQELLVSVNDSLFLLEQPSATAFPSEVRYRNEGNQRYAADLADTDGDGQLELLAKDFQDYFIFEGEEARFQEAARLPDVSPGYIGSIAPRVLVEDFDQDGQPEVVYGDFDGDLLVYEHRGGGSYAHTFLDTSRFTKSGVYLTAGDFDGDGVQEFFVAAHPPTLRNEQDFENEDLYWWLRIFEATGDDRYEVVWEEHLYDLDLESLNGATAGNLDADPAEELVFTTFPRTYVLEWQDGRYQFTWFYYGSLASHHVIGDFNGNGINELGLGRTDSTKFFERTLGRSGPVPVTQLRGFVLGPQAIRLRWPASTNATGYEIWRVRDPARNDQARVFTVGAVDRFEDRSLDSGVPYLYVLRAVNPALTPVESGFGNLAILTPKARSRLDSARARGPRRVQLYFDQPVQARSSDRTRMRLNLETAPQAILPQGNPGHSLLLSFERNLSPGNNRLQIDSSFLDAGQAYLDPAFADARFLYEPQTEECLHLTEWDLLDDKNALLSFNLPLDEALAEDSSHYVLDPVGNIDSVWLYAGHLDQVQVRISEARLGALGYPLSLTVKGLCAMNQLCLCPEGRTATFSDHKEDLSEVFAYPNPVKRHELFEGMRFANLTRQAQIKVLTLSGRLVSELEETDGDGGYTWDMRDRGGRRIKPGVYIYYVETEQEGVEPFMGKFSVVE